jgi:hypothetical protein
VTCDRRKKQRERERERERKRESGRISLFLSSVLLFCVFPCDSFCRLSCRECVTLPSLLVGSQQKCKKNEVKESDVFASHSNQLTLQGRRTCVHMRA